MIKDCFKRRECVSPYAFSALETVFNHVADVVIFLLNKHREVKWHSNIFRFYFGEF